MTLTLLLVYEVYPELLAEMYAYSMAAAHEVPHLKLSYDLFATFIIFVVY